MSTNGEPGEKRQPVLSVEELEALLRAPAPAAGVGSPSAGAFRVMLVSKRSEDLDPLAAALEGGGFEVTMARNPFTALDYLRARDFQAVIADFSLWRPQKDLLFERISQLDSGVEVIYLCDADATMLEEARRAKARWVMRRPIDVAELLGYVREIAGAASEEATDAEQSVAPLVVPTATSSSAVDRWYKFFFNVRREMRQWGEHGERWRRFLDLFVVAQGGGAVALLDITNAPDTSPDGSPDSSPDEGLALRVISVKAALDSTVDRGHGRQVLKRRLQATLSEAKRSTTSGGGGADTSLTSNGALVLGFPRASPRRLLVSVAPPSRVAIEIPPVITDELPFLLEEVERAI